VKQFLFLILIFLSFTTNACIFPPEGLIEKHQAQFNLLIAASFFIIVITLLLRTKHQKSRLWVPTISILVFGYFPFGFYILENFGILSGGQCGRPGLLFVGQICITGYLVIFIYELYKYIKYCRES